MDQTDLSDRFAMLMVAVRTGERALPLAWWVESGAANLGLNYSGSSLIEVGGRLPVGAPVLLQADRAIVHCYYVQVNLRVKY